MKQLFKFWLFFIICLTAAGTVSLAFLRPGYFDNPDDLAALLFLQILLAAVWNYRTRFFPVLLAAFLWGGMGLPLNTVWVSARWFVLGTGAAVGILASSRNRRPHFSMFHLVALFCFLAALISAQVSAYPRMAALKSLSLFLLFVYGATGARLAVEGRAERFISGLLLGCELLVYVSFVAYFIFQDPIFGNPNSLGAVMGVVAVPLLLWGTLSASQLSVRYRRTLAFLLALVLLLSSYARAGLAAAAVSCFLLCFALRRYTSFFKGLAVALLLALFVIAAVPLPNHPSESLTSNFLYKGRREDGILGSRKSVWDRTVTVIQQHPWFGSGFGTSTVAYEEIHDPATFSSAPQTTREHGNSYLAITAWVGVFGGIPFFLLIILVLASVIQTMAKVRRIRDLTSPCLPLAAVLAAGLVHAGFEDWLFAVGYYLCVFFWAIAFIIIDLLPAEAPAAKPWREPAPQPWSHNFDAATVNP